METEGTPEVSGEALPEVQNTEQATTESPESSPEPKKESQPSEEDNARKRINKLVWQREEAKREADYWRRQAQTGQEQRPKESPQPENGRPNINDPKWKYWEDYNEALAEWKAGQVIETRLKAERELSTKSAKQQRMASAVEAFNERAEKARDKYQDYDELFDNASISESMVEPIISSEQGPEIVVYLAKNPDVARRLYRLDPTSAAREIGKIEAKLDDLMKEPVSNAPPPMKTVRPKGEVSNELSDKSDIKTWMKLRNKQLGKK